MTVQSSVQAHASIMGSSTAERVINCPGSVARVATSPMKQVGDAALDGTACHAVTEHILLNGGDPADFIGTTTADRKITKDMAADIGIALASADHLLVGYDEQFVELRVTHTAVTVFGTSDLVGVSADGTKALIADHKFGYVEVAPNNYQNRFIAACAIEDPATIDIFANVEEFKLAIIQPSFEPAHTVHTVDRDDIRRFRRTMELALTTAHSPDAPLAIGSWCTYCPAKVGNCEAWAERGLDLVDLTKHAASWHLKNVAYILDVADKAMPLIEAAKERAKLELANGRKVEGEGVDGRVGWRLTNGRTLQKWGEEPVKVIEALQEKFGYEHDEVVDVITPAALKKLPYTKDLSAEDHVNLEKLITKSQTSPSLARDSDESGSPAVPAAAFARAAEAAKGGGSHLKSKTKQKVK